METKPTTDLLALLRHHVTGAIERGEGEAIVGIESPRTWWRCFDGETLMHICDVSEETCPDYDPRAGGSGNVVWQRV